MDGSEGIGVYGEAKAEYTRQLCSFLVPALETYFLDVLEDVKTTEKDPKRFLWAFQDALKQFPDWNIDKVQRETEKINTATKCDYLEEILTAVFIAHTKVLSAIRLTSRQKKLQITIPKIDHFLHRTMSECARLLWSNAYLFSESGTSIDRQKNLRQVEHLLQEGVLQSIRGMLPVKSILKEYLSEDVEETPAQEAASEAQDVQEDIAPVVHEESVVEAPKEETKEEVAPEAEAAEAVAEAAPEPQTEAVIETETAAAVTEPPVVSAPTIIVDTEPPTVSFTEMNTYFDRENPEKNSIQSPKEVDDDDEEGEVNYIEVDESYPPEMVDDFEELEMGKDGIAVGVDEFETL